MKKCEKCGAPIVDAEFLRNQGYTAEAKLCEKCRREVHLYRRKVNVERSLLSEWKGIKIIKSPLEFEKFSADEQVAIFRFGGRFFPSSISWTGASYNQKILFFVEIGLLDKNKKLKKGVIVDIRKMVKVVIDNQKEKTNEYFVVTKSKETVTGGYLDFLLSYYKTTLRGLGRDRDYKETIDCEKGFDVLAESSNSARSGRFGSEVALIVIPTLEYTIEKSGVA